MNGEGMLFVEVRDATGYTAVTHETSTEAAKDWLWRTLLACKTDQPAYGPARVSVRVIAR